MAANFRLLYDFSDWDAGTVDESSDKEKRRGRNALLHHPGKKWVTNADTGEWWKNDLGGAKNVDCIGIFGHNFTGAATVKIQASAVDDWVSPPVDVTLTIATDADGQVLPRIVYFWSSTQNYQYWRLTVDDASNPDGNIQIGRIVAGQYYEFARQPGRGVRVTHKDPSNIEHVGGSIQNIDDFNEAARFRQFRCDFPWRDLTERRKWEAMFRRVGNVRPVVLAADPTNYPSEMSGYCWIISDLDWVWEHSAKFDVMTVLFEEKTR